MAGNYADVPGHRFVMDRDGTQMYAITNVGVVTQLSTAQIQAWSDDGASPAGYAMPAGDTAHKVLIYFPEQRTLSGIYLAQRGNEGANATAIEYSTNTTNGTDGTWSTLMSPTAKPIALGVAGPNPTYRTSITPLALSNVRAIRLTTTNFWGGGDLTFHVYGALPITGSPTRLAIWHPTLDEPISGAYLDWGDSPRSSSADRTFRVKNLSGTLTANTITVGCDALTDGSPSVAGSHYLSDDGTTFTATETIASLAPGAISTVLTLRRILPSNAPLGLWSPRVHAVPASWS